MSRVNDVGEVQSWRPFPLESTSACIGALFFLHACDKLEQEKKGQYSKNMYIFVLLKVQREGGSQGKKNFLLLNHQKKMHWFV